MAVSHETYPIAFLDRDGTINVDIGYLSEPSGVELIPGAAHGIAILKRSGFIVVVVSNQSGIGRGYASEDDVVSTNREIQRQLLEADEHAVVDRISFSPYSPSLPEASPYASFRDTRKPDTGMVRDLIEQGLIDVSHSWMVGDKVCDLQFGINIGLCPSRCCLVLTGEGGKTSAFLRDHFSDEVAARFQICPNLFEAAKLIQQHRS